MSRHPLLIMRDMFPACSLNTILRLQFQIISLFQVPFRKTIYPNHHLCYIFSNHSQAGLLVEHAPFSASADQGVAMNHPAGFDFD